MDRRKELDMSGYLNRVQLIGNLGRDPEVRTTQTGKTVVTLVIATGESWKDDRGNRVERTEWHRIVIFSEGLGQIAEKYLQKGSKVYSRASSVPANGRTSRAQTATAPRSI
jgi:single-strand DNA-binding protein